MAVNAAYAMRDLQSAVRAYLQWYPQAADTLEGIRHWWLPDSMRSTPIELLRLALVEMLEGGELRCEALSDGSRLYALCRSATGSAS